jgi:hypothetical protein
MSIKDTFIDERTLTIASGGFYVPLPTGRVLHVSYTYT